jgi:hypothetical protein
MGGGGVSAVMCSAKTLENWLSHCCELGSSNDYEMIMGKKVAYFKIMV